MPRMRLPPRDGSTAAWAAQPAARQSAGQIVRTAAGAPLRMTHPRSTPWRASDTISRSVGARREALRSVARRLTLRHMPSGRTINTRHETERHVRLFRNSRNRTPRSPREFELAADEAILRKEGDRLVIEPVRKERLLALPATLEPTEAPFPNVDEHPVPPDDVELCG